MTSTPMVAGLSPTGQEFDTRDAQARLMAAQGSVLIMNYVGLAALWGFGAILAFLGSLRRDWIIVGFGAALLIFGGVMSWKVARDRRVQLRRVRVDASGVSLEFGGATAEQFRWADPRAKLLLVDYRHSNIVGLRSLSNVPCMVSGKRSGGIPFEAFLAIRETARAAGASVVDMPPNPGGRVVYIGNWPKVPRPFTPAGPYS
jgi:hypothetical protein